VVLLNNVYPGGIAGLFPGHPNLGRIAGQVALFGTVAGGYYQKESVCQAGKKYPFPTVFVDVPGASSTTRPPNTATATPYGQCEFLCSFSCRFFSGEMLTTWKYRWWLGHIYRCDALWRRVLVHYVEVSDSGFSVWYWV